MQMSIAVSLEGIERGDLTGTSPRSQWIANFSVVANGHAIPIVVPLRGDTPEEDLVKIARAALHRILKAAADHTTVWDIP